MTSEELALAAPTPETGSTSPPPVLNECVSVITAPDALSPHSSARKKGELSLSLLVRVFFAWLYFSTHTFDMSPDLRLQFFHLHLIQGFCYHVAKDHAILSKAISDNKMKDLQFSDIPAIRELLANPEVFNAFVSMLTPPSSGGSSGVGANPQQMTIGRKRAPSEDLTYSRKNQMLSPVLNRAQMNPEEKTQLPTAVLAATILGTVFQHVDHWPIQLIKSFAEDSFGPRAWVDDDRCSVLVANLEQSINLRHEVARLNDAIVSAAEEAEKYFSSLSTSNANSCRSVARSTSIQSKEPSSKEKQKLKARSKIDTDTSSSSGEEEVLESEILPCFSIASLPEQSHSLKDSFLHMLFSSNSASTEQVRPRYVSSNVELMYEVVSEALEERLNSKSKQNSRLLQTLPLFLQIPRVRVLASRHLERWLQSPALAGLARTLFAEIARHVEKVDPPLFDDVEVVDNILKLKLKANQLALFVEHLAAVVKTLPSVAKQVFTYCITKGDLNCESVKDKLQILRAVYVTLDRKNAAATLASSIIALESEVIELGSNRDKIILQYKELYAHLSQVVDMLDTAFDGFLFAESVIEAKSGTTLESNAENSSRLIFFCATLITRSVSSFERTDKVADDSEELSQFRTKILKFRKSIMKWCVEDLSPVYYKKVKQEEERKCLDSQFEHGVVVSGPGMADYNSVLNADSKFDISGHRSSFQQLMSIMRCLLFLCRPSSSDMDFLFGERLDDEHCKCVEFYCNNGVDIDDELVSS
jgi:integrator complex subunit 1